jgi:hypothetical protein
MDVYAELEKLRIEHWSDFGEGLNDCETFFGRECTCEAPMHNKIIDDIATYLLEWIPVTNAEDAHKYARDL